MITTIYGKSMLPLQVAWYLPLLIPSIKLVLPTQKHMRYSTQKLTAHTLPSQKNSPKNSQLTCYPTQKLTCEAMSSPSEVCARWGSCCTIWHWGQMLTMGFMLALLAFTLTPAQMYQRDINSGVIRVAVSLVCWAIVRYFQFNFLVMIQVLLIV